MLLPIFLVVSALYAPKAERFPFCCVEQSCPTFVHRCLFVLAATWAGKLWLMSFMHVQKIRSHRLNPRCEDGPHCFVAGLRGSVVCIQRAAHSRDASRTWWQGAFTPGVSHNTMSTFEFRVSCWARPWEKSEPRRILGFLFTQPAQGNACCTSVFEDVGGNGIASKRKLYLEK